MIIPRVLRCDRIGLLQLIKQNRPNIEIAVEIGTWRAEYAAHMCQFLQPTKFFTVDPYLLYEGMGKPDVGEYSTQESLDSLASRVSEFVSGFLPEGNAALIRKTSLEAANDFEDNSIDVVYIDGAHDYDDVIADMESWYQKVKTGGILCGHDYIERSHRDEFGVIPAVQKFVKDRSLRFAVTSDTYASWVIVKDSKEMFF